MATEKLFTGHPPPPLTHLHTLIFGSTLLVYNIPRVLKKRRLTVRAPYFIWYLLFFLAGLVITVYGLSSLSLKMFAGYIILGAFTFAYSWPLLPFKHKKSLRDFGWIKIIVLASVWTISTSVLPILTT